MRELAGEEDVFQRQGPYAVRINDEFTVEPRPAACGHSWDELRQYVQEIDLDGETIRVLGLEGLLIAREGSR